ncbi:HNH endonuclease [Pedobacter antarcticus]|nr:HNH endonuclease [Pedobacter antarcticus]
MNDALEIQSNDKITCLWCSLDAETSKLSFLKKAHTIPQSLGGKFLCKEVCDTCNHYFGSPGFNKMAIEVILREAFELTRNMVFTNQKKRSNHYARFKSNFFKLNVENRTFSLKQIYSIRPGFQQMIARQFKRGLFKVFLEELQRQLGMGMGDRFNFIREFARYDLGDYPVFYLVPKLPVLAYVEEEFIAPRLNFGPYQLERIDAYEFYEMNIFGHAFLIPTHKNWHLNYDAYLANVNNYLSHEYKKMIPINAFEDVDFACEFMNSKGST